MRTNALVPKLSSNRSIIRCLFFWQVPEDVSSKAALHSRYKSPGQFYEWGPTIIKQMVLEDDNFARFVCAIQTCFPDHNQAQI